MTKSMFFVRVMSLSSTRKEIAAAFMAANLSRGGLKSLPCLSLEPITITRRLLQAEPPSAR